VKPAPVRKISPKSRSPDEEEIEIGSSNHIEAVALCCANECELINRKQIIYRESLFTLTGHSFNQKYQLLNKYKTFKINKAPRKFNLPDAKNEDQVTIIFSNFSGPHQIDNS